MNTHPKFSVGDIIRTRGGKTPWRIDSIGPGQLWMHSGRDVYRCVSLTSGRREEHRITSTWIEPWTGPLPTAAAAPVRLKGHALVAEGAPFDNNRVRTNGYRTRGTGRALCSCGDLSDILESAGERKRWHAEHKAAIRAEQAA